LSLLFSIVAFYNELFLAGLTAAGIALIFSAAVYRNIIAVRRMQKEKRMKKD